MEESISYGVSRLYEWGGLVTVLVLICVALGWFSLYLIKRNSALSDRFADIVVKNTETIAEFKEVLRGIVAR